MNRRDFIGAVLAIGAATKLQLNTAIADDPLRVVLKLDDLVGYPKTGLSNRWEMVISFLNRKKIPASFGVIGDALYDGNTEFNNSLIEISKSELFELWNHGYYPTTSKSLSTNFLDSEQEQFEKLTAIQWKLFQLTGRFPTFFGPHAGNVNKNTFAALNRIPSIKGIWFFNPPSEYKTRFVVIRRDVEAEKPIFFPRADNIQKRSNFGGVMALQFHPNQWSDDQFEIFSEIVTRLISSGARFVLPSRLL